MPNTLTADTITDDRIRALRAEAVAAGDPYQVGLCDLAQGLEHATDMTAREARQACADAINGSLARLRVECADRPVAKPEPLTADTITNAAIVAQREAAEQALLEARLTLERCDRALLYDADARRACADQANEEAREVWRERVGWSAGAHR